MLGTWPDAGGRAGGAVRVGARPGAACLRSACCLASCHLALGSDPGPPGGAGERGLYDGHCRGIEERARSAGALYNQGRQAEAYAALEASRQSFREARRLVPSAPQAYVSMATALLNSNQLDEAIPLWRRARDRVEDEHARRWIDGRIRWARFGKVSMRRDRVYAGGQGNITAALALMERQLELYPDSPVLRRDRATALAMASALQGASAVRAAAEGFAAAQEAAFEAWRAGVLQRGRGGPECDRAAGAGGGLVYDWPSWHERGAPARGALAALSHVGQPEGAAGAAAYGSSGTFRDHGAYVARLESVGLSGDDGVIVDEARCTVFVASSGSFVDLALNLQLLELWGGPPSPHADGPRFAWHDHHGGRLPEHGAVAEPLRVASAASILGFAAASHFHALTEVLGRLQLLAGSGALAEPGLRLVAPGGARRGGFLGEALRMLAPRVVEEGRVLWWRQGGAPDVRLRAEVLHCASWRPPAALGEDGGHCATPRSVLLGVRAALLGGLSAADREAPAPAPAALVLVSRREGAMRGRLVGWGALRAGLAAAAAAARPSPLRLEDFDGSPRPAAAVALFARARAVVGVHGGALANMLFCGAGAEIFELGFPSPFAGHYRHLAAALGLRLASLPLVADERGIGAQEVRLADPEAAVQAVSARLSGAAARAAEL